jgi:predicted DNA-binding protein/mRNA-degrading endonuclease RelE of RelBE toxin-antitoxin system
MISISLPIEIENRLTALATATGRTNSFYAHQAIVEHLDDLEDLYLAEKTLLRIRSGMGCTYSLAEVEAELGLGQGCYSAIELSEQTQRQLRKFDKPAAKRITSFLRKFDKPFAKRITSFLFLGERLASIYDPRSMGEALKGSELGTFWKYRVGDYRLICEIDDGVLKVLDVIIGNRHKVYTASTV